MTSTTYTLQHTYTVKNRIQGVTIEGKVAPKTQQRTLQVEMTVYPNSVYIMGMGDSAGGFYISVEDAWDRYQDLLSKGYTLVGTTING